MALLLVSIGNSRTACARLGSGGVLEGVVRLDGASSGDVLRVLPGSAVHILSVVEDRGRALVLAAREIGREAVWWGNEREIPVRHPYVAPGMPGADRLVAALAAFRRVRAACVVVDAGTAVTVDVVSGDGAFLGGAIAPGLRTLAAALRAKAPALPLADAEADPAYPATSTADAVAIGVQAAFRGALRDLVARGREAAGGGTVLVTGGDARPAALALEKHRPTVVPDLVLEGLATLAQSSP
jgi:type III pantothenate kinase